MATVASHTVKLAADTDGLCKGLGEAHNRFDKAKKAAKILAVGVAAVGTAAVAFGASSVKAYNEQAAAEAKLIQLHHENTGATMGQTKELMNLAGEVQKYGVVGDEAIIAGQAQLSTFKLNTDAIKSLTPAMTDMVAQQKGVNATGDDFVNIGNLIGKVMEGNIGALGRYGVSFDETSENILKTGTESERAAELAKVLEANYGGVNKALRDTPEGKIQALKNRFGDLQEGVGKLITEAMGPLLDILDGWFSSIEEAGGLMEYLKEKFKVFFDIWASATALFEKFKGYIQPIIEVFSYLGNIIKDSLISAWDKLKEAIIPLLPILKWIGIIVGGIILVAIVAVIAIIVGLIAVFAKLIEAGAWLLAWIVGNFMDSWKSAKEAIMKFRDAAVEAWNNLKEKATEIFNAIKVFLTNTWNAIKDFSINTWNAIKERAASLWENLKSVITGPVKDAKNIIIDVFNAVKDKLIGIWDKIKSGAKIAFEALITTIKIPLNAIINLVNKAIRGLNKFKVSVPEGVPVIGGKTFGINIPTIPTLHAGGVFRAPKLGGEGLALLRDRERVLPADHSTTSGDIIITGNTFHVREEADIEKIARKLTVLREARA